MEQGPDEREDRTLEGVTAGGHSPAPSEAQKHDEGEESEEGDDKAS